MKKRLLFLTGSPGVGKTSVLLKVVEALMAKGYSVGGMVSREIRSCGTRIGFEILDLRSHERGWLAHVNQRRGPRIGRYRVNIDGLNAVGVRAIAEAIENSDVVVVDEIGPMELFSERFKETVERAIKSGKLVIGTVHWRVKDSLIDEVRSRGDAEVITVTYENRGALHETVIKKALDFLSG